MGEKNRIKQYDNTDSIINRLKNDEPILVFGARIVAKEITTVLYGRPYEANILGHVVTSLEENPDTFMGKKVFSIEDAIVEFGNNITVVLACMEKHLDEIADSLLTAGYQDIIPLSFESDLWADVRWEYFKVYCNETGRKCLEINEYLSEQNALSASEKKISVFNARFHKDKQLKEDISKYDWEIPIQVAADMADKKICEIQDNQGENISARNYRYSELTALYWIWKHFSSDYIGISHYRRHFNLNSELLEKLGKSDIDVIVTVPILNFPSVRAVYDNDHFIEDWDITMQAIKELYPEYYETAKSIEDGCFYYAYNMMIASEKIFNEYCRWLFDILFYCEKRCKEYENPYQNRLMGFLSERLMTVFLEYHKDEYKLVHCKKHFIF